MGNYVYKLGTWVGHSENDTIPDPVGKYLHRRRDTDTGIVWYSDNIRWKRLDQIGGSDIDLENGLLMPILDEAPTDPEEGNIVIYPKLKDAGNHGVFAKMLVDGEIEEAEIGIADDVLNVEDLANVNVASPAANQALVYQSGSASFENKKLKTRAFITTTYNGTSNGDRYIALGSAAGSLSTETNIDYPLGFALKLKRVRIRITTNSRDAGNQVFELRKNQATVAGTTHSVASTQTTAFNSAELNVDYAIDDDICLKIAVGGTTGTLTAVIYVEYEVEAYV